MASLKLINRAEFARLAGVSSAAVTKACKNTLGPAVVGKRIDMNHPAAKEYLERKEDGEILATGFDPLYEKAVEVCRQLGSYSIRTVKANLKVGSERAKKIVGLMSATGVIPNPDEPPPAIEPPKPKQRVLKSPTISGHAARNNTKKAAALDNIDGVELRHEIPDNILTFLDYTLYELIQKFGSDYAFHDWLKSVKEIELIAERRLKNAQTRGDLVNKELVKRGIIEPIDEVFVNLLSDGARTLATRVPALDRSGESAIEIENYISDYIGKFIKKSKVNIKKVVGRL